MKKEESFNPESEYFNNLLNQYEEMLTTGKSIYFDSSDLIDIAEHYTITEQYNKALNSLDYGLQLHPDNTELLIMKGSVLLEKKDIEKARILINSLPFFYDYDIFLLKASLAIYEKEINKAENILAEIEKHTGSNTDFYLDAAYIYCDGNNPQKAIEWFEKAFSNNPKDLEALEEYAQCCFFCKKFDKIISYYQIFIDNNPYNSLGWYGLSRVYMEYGESEKALENIDFALAIDPDNEASILLKAAAYFQLGNYEYSLNLYQELSNRDPENAQFLFLLGLAYYNLEEYQQAISHLETARNLNSHLEDDAFKTDLLHTLAMAYKHNNEISQAIEIINQILNTPSLIDTGTYLLKAEFELENQNLYEANKYFHMALSYNEFNPIDTYLRILTAFENYNMLTEGIRFMEQIFQTNTKNPLPLLSLAYCYSQLGENKKAQKYTEQALHIDPNSVSFFQKAQDELNFPFNQNQ